MFSNVGMPMLVNVSLFGTVKSIFTLSASVTCNK